MGTRTAIDIGGTFTDLVYLDETTGQVGLGKTSTTPAHFEEGVLTAVNEAHLEDVQFLAHGTTVIINTLTERKGAVTALITTRGFRDILEIQRANRPDLYNLLFTKPRPFVPRRLRLEVTERMNYKGEVLQPLVEDDVRAAVTEARRQGAQAIAICFLHSYANPAHEQRAAEIIREAWPDVDITASHELTNEWREFHRTSTVVLDAYVKPVARRYLEALSRRLDETGIKRNVRYAMQSNGGISRFELAGRTPINLVESGPVGGIIGAAVIGKLLDEQNIITLDIGGTTAKSSLVERGTVRVTSDYFIERTPTTAGYPIKVPVVDIVEIGAGGGSIAWIDPAGALKVGPRSAGAEPGPASYGRGGTEPTVTDANLVLGFLAADTPLAGGVELDVAAAERAVGQLAADLDLDPMDCAEGIVRVAAAEMARALRVVTVQRGVDPRGYALLAFGGAGPLHAAWIAEEIGVTRILCPRTSGVLAALGLVVSERRRDAQQSLLLSGDALTQAAITQATGQLAEMARRQLSDPTANLRATYELRYRGQSFELSVPGRLDA